MPINYTPKFNKKIRQILHNYNRKVARLESKYPNSRSIPPHITASGLKNNYENKGELVAKLKQLESFSQKAMQQKVSVSKENVQTSAYNYKSYLLNKKVAERKIEHLLELNRAKDKQEGRIFGSHRTRSLEANLRTLQLTNKKHFSYQSFLASQNMASRYTDRREETDKQFYENFFDMLWANQIYAEIDEDLVQQAHDMLEKLTPEQLLELYNREPDVQRLVEDYNLYTDTQGYSLTDDEAVRARVRFEALMDELPLLVEKYSKL
jgi:hypothetical protein